MNGREARRILAGTLHFGDDMQIRAHQALERILVAKELIKSCSLVEHFSYLFKPSIGHDKAEYLEDFEDEVLDCEECRAKIRDAEGLYIDELLAAVAELFDEWWEETTKART